MTSSSTGQQQDGLSSSPADQQDCWHIAILNLIYGPVDEPPLDLHTGDGTQSQCNRPNGRHEHCHAAAMHVCMHRQWPRLASSTTPMSHSMQQIRLLASETYASRHVCFVECNIGVVRHMLQTVSACSPMHVTTYCYQPASPVPCSPGSCSTTTAHKQKHVQQHTDSLVKPTIRSIILSFVRVLHTLHTMAAASQSLTRMALCTLESSHPGITAAYCAVHSQQHMVALPAVGWVQSIIPLVIQQLSGYVGLCLVVAGRVQQASYVRLVSCGPLQTTTHTAC
jgi:hypothetical protein